MVGWYRHKHSIRVAVAIFVWMSLVLVGMVTLLRYEFAPGMAAQAPMCWPPQTGLKLDPQRPTLVMVIHPRCFCSQSSIEELDGLLSHYPDRASVVLLFIRPQSASAEWVQTESWQAAQRLPGAQLLVDLEGVEASRFGAKVSGQTYLYSPSGRLLFSGGITGSRGHTGTNPGSTALCSQLLNPTETRSPARANVFGCGAVSPRKGPTCRCQHCRP